jgi:hypothetical protein
MYVVAVLQLKYQCALSRVLFICVYNDSHIACTAVIAHCHSLYACAGAIYDA